MPGTPQRGVTKSDDASPWDVRSATCAVVFWRKADGTITALEDACWHRLLPLSLGWLEGDEVVCRYHGLAFDGQGQCTRMPSQEKLNPRAACGHIRSSSAIDLSGSGSGIPRAPKPTLVPDMHWNDDPDWAGDGQTMFAKCNYRLFVDNLMDLTHESFVHATSIGNKHVAETPLTTTHSGRTVTATRWMLDVEPPPFWRAQLNKPGQCRPLADHQLRGAVHDRP